MTHVLIAKGHDVIQMSIDLEIGLCEILNILGISGEEEVKEELHYLICKIMPVSGSIAHEEMPRARVLLEASKGMPVWAGIINLKNAVLRVRLSEVAYSKEVGEACRLCEDSVGTSVRAEALKLRDEILRIHLFFLSKNAHLMSFFEYKEGLISLCRHCVGTPVEKEALETLSMLYKK